MSLIIGDFVVKPYGKLPYVGQKVKGHWDDGVKVPCEIIEIKSLEWDGRDLKIELFLKVLPEAKNKKKTKLKLIVNSDV